MWTKGDLILSLSDDVKPDADQNQGMFVEYHPGDFWVRGIIIRYGTHVLEDERNDDIFGVTDFIAMSAWRKVGRCMLLYNLHNAYEI